MVELIPVDVSGLDVFDDPCDLRRDIHVFVQYVQEREVKRLHRSNGLSKADSRQLAKGMSDPEAQAQVKEDGDSDWVGYVDWLCLKLGFVHYDTKGTYAGYTSSEPSFPDNYIEFRAPRYQQFLQAPLAKQERRLLDVLITQGSGCDSEFFCTAVLGLVDGFPSWGCATGVVPTLDFARARRFLLDLLHTCQVGVWYSTASLIQYLKTVHPFFLIPKKPKYKSRWDRDHGRYGNFQEGQDRWERGTSVPETAVDAFERVEGRYVERFLEGFPLLLGYVDVAYEGQPYSGNYPSLNHLQAFRVNNRLVRAIKGDMPLPKVTVQPNFEIYVESEFYPANVLSKLIPLTDVVSTDVLTILRLRKTEVAAQSAQDESLDVISLLIDLSGQELPQNVARELAEWSAHAEKFVLYHGFALLEGDEHLPAADPFTVECISPTVRIVRSPDALYDRLQESEWMPMRVKHAGTLVSLPPAARTLFARRAPVSEPRPEEKAEISLVRQTVITLHFPDDELLERVRRALLAVMCPVEVSKADRTISFSKQHESLVAEAIEALRHEYSIHIQDI